MIQPAKARQVLNVHQEEFAREPVFNIPAPLLWLSAVAVLMHLFMEYAPPEIAYGIRGYLTFIPVRYHYQEFLAASPLATLISPIGYTFVHASWTHVIMNTALLVAFGVPLFQRTDRFFFLLVYIGGALAGAASVYLLSPQSPIEVVGSSASVSALLGALAGIALARKTAEDGPQPGFLQTRRKTLAFIGIWVFTNILFGILPAELFGVNGRIAWEAHLGGFAIGLILAFMRK